MSSETTLQNIDIKRLKTLFPDDFKAAVGDDFAITEVTYENVMVLRDQPCRFDGYLAIFCFRGELTMDINLNTYNVKENSLLITVPGYIVRLSGIDPQKNKDLHFVLVAMSKEYMENVHMDFNRMFSESVALLDNPSIVLTENELEVCRKYMALATDLAKADVPNKRTALGALVASVLFILGSVWSERISKAKSTAQAPSTRAKSVFDQFLRLVTDYHTSERNMAFYADRLFLTPKYLSKLIKNVSGRSAPEWIDSFVVLEAKNMLKYSDMTIKQIVYKLNFPNQSVFYKFFKAHTGMTPSEYRAS